MATFSSAQIVLFSSDLPRAVAFYTEVGFAEVFRDDADGAPVHVDLVLDGCRLGLASAASARDDHDLSPVTAGQRAAVVLWTDDIVAAFETLRALGAPVVAAPGAWRDRLLVASVEDPDGHVIQLVQEHVA